jgi:hypothetical protein
MGYLFTAGLLGWLNPEGINDMGQTVLMLGLSSAGIVTGRALNKKWENGKSG